MTKLTYHDAKHVARRAVNKIWRDKNKERQKGYRRGPRADAHRAERYGLTPDQYAAMQLAQGGKCAICRQAPTEVLRIDHDHVTGLVRALLCRKCNGGLGFFGDSVALVARALAYLLRHDARGRRRAPCPECGRRRYLDLGAKVLGLAGGDGDVLICAGCHHPVVNVSGDYYDADEFISKETIASVIPGRAGPAAPCGGAADGPVEVCSPD